jgi:hypothetical protein
MNRPHIHSGWLAPLLHLLLFGLTLLIASMQSQPLLDGPARIGFDILFFTDLPTSAVAFSLMWNEKMATALVLWGIAGTIQWYLGGLVVRWLLGRSRNIDIPN